MRRFPWLGCLLFLAASCAGQEAVRPPEPPVTEAGPGIGRLLDLNLEENGPISVRAVTGRVTVVCVIGEEGGPVVQACRDASARFGDRITVFGLSTSSIDRRAVPFRVYPDPDGAQLQEKLGLDSEPKVLATDKRGRIARVIGVPDLDVLEASIRRLVD